ncbi:MAG: proline--tRNA ligase, partial [Propionibacteriaceae bacterium]|nr:proline--tRNA ligase [Propionibacteriaceae bacterium]
PVSFEGSPSALLGSKASSQITYLTDPRVVEGSSWVTGANVPDTHVAHLVMGRDFTADGVIDVAQVREGDPSPDGSGPLTLARGVEMGHIFQLGRKYAEALGLKVLDANGKLVTVTMGSYGIGVSRAVAMVAEATCDEKGLAWPRDLAPYDVIIVVAGKDAAMLEVATTLASSLEVAGAAVVVDDRKVSPGVKFADAELIGFPTSVVIGRGLKDGVIEVRDRAAGTSATVPLGEAVSVILEQVQGQATPIEETHAV